METPASLDANYRQFVLELGIYALVASAIATVCILAVAAILYRKSRGEVSENIATIILKLSTIMAIAVAVTFLATIKAVRGETALAILSSMAGYVLGNLSATSAGGKGGGSSGG